MTHHSSTILARVRAIWPACLAFVLIGTLALPLSGCGDAADPMAPAASEVGKARLSRVPVTTDLDAALAVTAPGYGRWLLDAASEPVIVHVLPDQPIQFFWRAVDGVGLGNRPTFRYGWNVVDPDDPLDPGWMGPPTAGGKSQQTSPRIVWAGSEDLIIERWDGDRLLVRAFIEVWSMPVGP